MGLVLLAVNLGFAAAVGVVVKRWVDARRAAVPVDPAGTVCIRLRRRPWDDEEVDRCVRRALGATTLVPTGPGGWGSRDGSAARVTPPVVGDRVTLVEVSAREADAVVAGLVDALLEAGYEVSRQQGRRLALRRGPDRVDLQVDPV
ncbi:MAG TPA: hypothetical protein VD926_12835 [Acidimicrobiales bacterium]|nr:hypothetical protein [Acidimicrobiales bacterium]